MARAIWTGALSFGLVNVPVGLYSATSDHEVRFHQFQRGTSSRIRNRRVNEDTGKEVDYDEIVSGADVGGGEYVLVTPEELESVEPGRSRTIDISDFVDAAEIDPIYYRKSYYLGPSDDGAYKAYALLVKAMDRAGRIGIASFVMRGKQYLAAVRPAGKVLVLSTLYFADEVRDPEETVELPGQVSTGAKDLGMAVHLIEAMTTRWAPGDYRDTYTERVEQLIEAKRKDFEVVTESAPEPSADVLDLMAALQSSVEAARKRRGGKAEPPPKLRTRKAGSPEKARSKKADSKKAEPSKKELYDLAQRLEVPGRSTMTREELVAAVAKAGKKDQKAS
jgi:DNA end-binding protein Ku